MSQRSVPPRRRTVGAAGAAVAAVAIGLAVGMPTSAASTVVTISDSLSPKSLTVAAGTTVTWRNADGERHRVRSRSGSVEFDSGNLDSGGTWSFTFRAVGVYPYVDDRDREASSYWGTVTVVARVAGSTAPGTGAPPSSGTATKAIAIVDRRFSPSSVTVDAGTTVRWRNGDGRDHTVTAGDGSFDSGVLSGGATFSRRFATAGTFRFLCAIHPEMTGSVTVRGTSTGSVPSPAKPTPTPKASGGPSVPSLGGDAAVRIVDFAFQASTTTVAAGSTVTWRNTGAAPHTITSSSGAWDSGLVASGASFSRRFSAAGSYAFVCSFHPEMRGVVVVTSAPGNSEPPAPQSAVGSTGPGPASPPPPEIAEPPTAVAAAEASPATVAASPAGAAEGVVRALLVGGAWLSAVGVLAVAVRSTVRSR